MSDPVSGLAVGSRVAVRTRISPAPGPLPHDGPSLTDTVGELVAVDAESLTVATRAGEVRLERDRVTAAKVIPPRPSRRGAPHRAPSVGDLQRLMVAGHPPIERGRIGEWLLRAADGYTGRANSLLPVGDPGLPLESAIDKAREWYAARGLDLLVQLALPEGADPSDDPLGALLLGQGCHLSPPVLVMTGATAQMPDFPLPQDYSLEVDDEPTDAFLDASGERLAAHRAAAIGILTRSADPAYLRAVRDDATAAVVRSPLHDGWVGLFGLHVDPTHRRQGLGAALTGAVAARARARGIRSLYLQVEADTEPAVALYRGMGLGTHHVYWYLRG
ncbi:GNAT family N-acetyltransferase [Actinomycetota bacterium]